ncbi:MAG: hypothetical protein CL897_03200 [Dehalococcoidia bacterium]|nr:hypothetical protein [Dehalococcoidia bacterium]
MIEHEMARSVLLERSKEENSPELRFRKEWRSLSAKKVRITDAKSKKHPVSRFLQRREGGQAA